MPIREEDDLNLPDAPDFVSNPPVYTFSEMIELCEKMLPEWNKIRFAIKEPEFIGEAFSLEPLSAPTTSR